MSDLTLEEIDLLLGLNPSEKPLFENASRKTDEGIENLDVLDKEIEAIHDKTIHLLGKVVNAVWEFAQKISKLNTLAFTLPGSEVTTLKKEITFEKAVLSLMKKANEVQKQVDVFKSWTDDNILFHEDVIWDQISSLENDLDRIEKDLRIINSITEHYASADKRLYDALKNLNGISSTNNDSKNEVNGVIGLFKQAIKDLVDSLKIRHPFNKPKNIAKLDSLIDKNDKVGTKSQ